MDKIFFRGLLTLIPITLTIYILYSVVLILENFLGTTLRQFWPGYVPGVGFILTLICIFIFGLRLNNFFTARFLGLLEKQLSQIPFVKAIYSPLRDIMNLFSKNSDSGLKHVVLVRLLDQPGNQGALGFGLVTRDQFQDLNLGGAKDHENDLLQDLLKDKVAVYFPLSYAMGGMTLLVPKKNVQAVDIPFEKAMSLAITGWIKAEESVGHK